MRINKADRIGGVPILRVRDALKSSLRLADGWFSLASLTKWLNSTEEEARVVLVELIELDYVEPLRDGWRTTIPGNALAFAKLGTVPRERAQRELDAFLDRVREVNRTDHYLCRVEQVILFGSFLDATVDPVGDVDLSVELAWKEEDGDLRVRQLRARSEAASAAGRSFHNYSEFLGWPMTEVQLYLKSRRRALSITHNAIPEDASTRVIYRRGMPDQDPLF